MHLTIIVGGWLSLWLGSPLPALLLLIVLKAAANLRAPVVLLAAAVAPAGAQTVAIRGVTVIPMTGAESLPDRTVVIRDGRIVGVEPAARTTLPPGAVVVEGGGRYLIPGLFDMHTHASKARASAFGIFVAHGVTTVRDQGSEHAEVLRWRREIRSGARGWAD